MLLTLWVPVDDRASKTRSITCGSGLALAGEQVKAATLMSMRGQFYRWRRTTIAPRSHSQDQSDILGSLPKFIIAAYLRWSTPPARVSSSIGYCPNQVIWACSSCPIATGIVLRCVAFANMPRRCSRAKATCWFCPMRTGRAKRYGCRRSGSAARCLHGDRCL